MRGRIDHLAIDLGRRRLFVAELGNDSMVVIDIDRHRTVRTLTGRDEPQGIGYVPSTDTVYVANGGDGTVRLFRGAALSQDAVISLGRDADDVRVGDTARRVFATAPGARTGLFVLQLDRLLLAVRRTSSDPAAVWVFRPRDTGAAGRIDP